MLESSPFILDTGSGVSFTRTNGRWEHAILIRPDAKNLSQGNLAEPRECPDQQAFKKRVSDGWVHDVVAFSYVADGRIDESDSSESEATVFLFDFTFVSDFTERCYEQIVVASS